MEMVWLVESPMFHRISIPADRQHLWELYGAKQVVSLVFTTHRFSMIALWKLYGANKNVKYVNF